MPDKLAFKLVTLRGEPLCSFTDHAEGEVVVPISDSRSAKVSVPIDEPKLQFARPLSTLLKAYYRGKCVCAGPLLIPDFEPDSDKVTLSTEMSARLNKAPVFKDRFQFAFGPLPLPSAGGGVSTDTDNSFPISLYQAIYAARVFNVLEPAYFEEPHSGVPDIGLYPEFGGDTGIYGTGSMIQGTKGQQAWAIMQAIAQLASGPDFDLVPMEDIEAHSSDTDLWWYAQYGMHAANWGGPPIGSPAYTSSPHAVQIGTTYQRLNVWNRKGRELQDAGDDTVILEYGRGKANCSSFSWKPAGDRVVNQFYLGASSGSGIAREARDAESLSEYGRYAMYEGAGNGQNDLPWWGITKAEEEVAAYSQPPNFFTIKPAVEASVARGEFAVPPELFTDYEHGDTIRVRARKGILDVDLVGRITRATLNEVAGGVEATLDMVPRVPAPTPRPRPPFIWYSMGGA